MSTVKVSLFSQITSLLDRQSFGKIVRKLDTDKHSKGLGSCTHLVRVDSIMDISKGLQTSYGDMSHVGIERHFKGQYQLLDQVSQVELYIVKIITL